MVVRRIIYGVPTNTFVNTTSQSIFLLLLYPLLFIGTVGVNNVVTISVVIFVLCKALFTKQPCYNIGIIPNILFVFFVRVVAIFSVTTVVIYGALSTRRLVVLNICCSTSRRRSDREKLH